MSDRASDETTFRTAVLRFWAPRRVAHLPGIIRTSCKTWKAPHAHRPQMKFQHDVHKSRPARPCPKSSDVSSKRSSPSSGGNASSQLEAYELMQTTKQVSLMLCRTAPNSQHMQRSIRGLIACLRCKQAYMSDTHPALLKETHSHPSIKSLTSSRLHACKGSHDSSLSLSLLRTYTPAAPAGRDAGESALRHTDQRLGTSPISLRTASAPGFSLNV